MIKYMLVIKWKIGGIIVLNNYFKYQADPGRGKAQPDDTIIPTPSGNKLLKDLKVGDYVFNRFGKPVKILGVYEQGMLEAYMVTFSDGRSTICNDEHLWSVYTSKGNLKTVTTRYMMEKGLVNLGPNKRGHKFAVPQSKAVEYPEKDLKVDPYVMGAFLGNGCLKEKQLTFSSNDEETVEEIRKIIGSEKYKKNSEKNYSWVYRLPVTYSKEKIKRCQKNFHTSDLFKDYPELIGADSHNKRIPKDYFNSSIDQRWSLIQGLFDTDGSIRNQSRASISYSTVSLGLAKDIKEILASLGFSSRIHERKRNRRWGNVEYVLYVLADNNIKHKFFRLSRKKDIAIKYSTIKKNRNYEYNYIYSIDDLGYKTPMRCIYVDDPEHLYLTNDYIVTHNTFLVRYLIDRVGLSYDEVLFVAFMGKAASQLARNGLPAKTIHSAIYKYEKQIARDENGKMIFKDNGKPKMKNVFVKKEKIGKNIKLIVCDEGSMVDEKTALDLMSFGIPIIVLGDLNQLPPVFGKPFFLQNPDVELHQIMRQAEGNPIIWLSEEILAGNELKIGVYGKSAVIKKSDLTDYHFRNADIILTCTNRLRYNVNNYCREEIKGIKQLDYPHINEKIVCRKNNWNKEIDNGVYLTNGTCGFVDDVYRSSFNGKTMSIDFRPDFTNSVFKNVTFDYKHLYEVPGGETDEQDFTSIYNDKIEFGYAITVHSSQGSQWNNPLFLAEDSMWSKEDRKKAWYTAVTRAVNSITIVI